MSLARPLPDAKLQRTAWLISEA